MGKQVQATDHEGAKQKLNLNRTPDSCPLCSKHVQPDFLDAVMNHPSSQAHAIFRCPACDCRGLFVAIYRSYRNPSLGGFSAELTGTTISRYTERKAFPNNIQAVSSSFCQIYNQALVAEENDLGEICGPGYRKALEFLIKDYLVAHKFKADSTKQAEVKHAILGQVIERFIDEERIKQCAKRAAWLGNDETHYLRKWTNQDVSDLKSLIVITANYIDMVLESERYMREMQPGGPTLPATQN